MKEQPKQLPLPSLPRPAAEVFFEKWRAILGTKPPQPKKDTRVRTRSL